MTDYSHIVADDLVLESAAYRRTPYDNLVLDIDEDGDVRLFVETCYGGDGVSFAVWHNRTMRYTLIAKGRCVIDVAGAKRALAEGGKLAVLIDRLIAGHDTKWDGSNMVGTLDDDAQKAHLELDGLIDSGYFEDWVDDSWSFYLESDWVQDEARGWIGAATTDKEIAKYLANVRKTAGGNSVILEGDATGELQSMRDAKLEEVRDKCLDALCGLDDVISPHDPSHLWNRHAGAIRSVPTLSDVAVALAVASASYHQAITVAAIEGAT